MHKSFNDIIENLRQTLVKHKAAHVPLREILIGLSEWRRNGNDGVRIGNGDTNKIGWDNLLHRRIAQNLREILLRVGEADNKKGQLWQKQ